jgi:hypothetical protein
VEKDGCKGTLKAWMEVAQIWRLRRVSRQEIGRTETVLALTSESRRGGRRICRRIQISRGKQSPDEKEVPMKRFFLIFVVTMAASACAMAQDAVTTNDSGAAPQELGVRTVVGCLSKTGNTYVITGGGPSPKQYRIVAGDVSALKGKLGYTVKVMGILAKNDALANQNGLYNAGSTTGVGYLTIDAKQIWVMYANCSNPGQEWGGEHK